MGKSMYQQFEELYNKWGPATPACMLGHRDTAQVKNWKKRKNIPKEHRVGVRAMLDMWDSESHPSEIKRYEKKH